MNKEEILIIDDEAQIRRLLDITLSGSGYKVLLAATAAEGMRMAAMHPPDLILLDIGLPDKSGHELLRELRQWYDRAIIILSVQQSEQDIVAALDNGATDYVAKPFRTAELLARIRSAIRRNAATATGNIFITSDLHIDMAARTVSKDGQLLHLTATEFNLLALFARNEGRVLTHKYLLREIWGPGYQTETQYLRVFVATLRRKIEDNPNQPRHIITESRVGYRFA